MASTQTAGSKNNDKPKAAEEAVKAPSGYVQESTDVVGFWDGDKKKPIHGIPLFVNLSDSDADESKPSALVFVRLVEPCKVQSAEGEGKVADRPEVEAKPGDIVGVWFSAGMRDLAMTAGRKTWMLQTGEKDVGKPSKMKVYKVMSEKGSEPKLIPVREDRRKESAGVKASPFAGTKKVAPVDSGDAGDDMPF